MTKQLNTCLFILFHLLQYPERRGKEGFGRWWITLNSYFLCVKCISDEVVDRSGQVAASEVCTKLFTV